MKSLNLLLAAMLSAAVSASAESVLDGYEKIAEYNAQEAAQAKPAWQAKNYRAGKITVKDGKVLIDNGDTGRDCYGSVGLLSPDLYQLDGAKIALKANLQIVKANGTDNVFAMMVDCGNGKGQIKDASVFLAPGKVVVGGVGTTRTNLIAQGKPFECILTFDPAKCEITVYVDGNKVVGLTKDMSGKQESVWFGDGSGSVSGQVEIESIELYRSEN